MIRILLLEDNPLDAELVTRELRRGQLEFEIERVETEEGFRIMLAASPRDIILADNRLPGFTGLDALRIARQLAPDVPFIFVSGSLGEERAVEALREGATDYIVKDRPSRLPSAIERALREADERRLLRAAEAALIESEQRFRYAALATRDVICDYDVATMNTVVSESLATEWGYDVDTVDAEWWLDKIHPDDRDRVSRVMTAAIQTGSGRFSCEFRFRRSDGSYGRVLDRALVVRDSDGRPLRVIGAMQDITDRTRLREQLEQAERVSSLGRLAATIAHEFNNLLMGIQPFAEVLQKRHRDDESSASATRQILASVARGKRITEEILRMARVPSPVAQTIDLNRWLADAEPELRAMIGTSVDLRIRPLASPAFVTCDSEQLHQVISNLAINARDAMVNGGTLDIRVIDNDPAIEIEVADNGTGMPRHVLDRVFEPLFTTKRQGTGLGLAIAQRLVTQNGGALTVESQLGVGTTFRLALPRSNGHIESAREIMTLPEIRVARVLLVEDEPSIAEGMRLLLEAHGILVMLAESGAEAMTFAAEMRPDAALLDLCLPDCDGTEVADVLCERWPDLPIVFTSGHLALPNMGERKQRNRTAFLRKPFDTDTLLRALNDVTSDRRAAS